METVLSIAIISICTSAAVLVFVNITAHQSQYMNNLQLERVLDEVVFNCNNGGSCVVDDSFKQKDVYIQSRLVVKEDNYRKIEITGRLNNSFKKRVVIIENEE